ncbi:DNA-binding response regulator, OmpR family, contains REC and winged-helix (wHTH) domain [Pilibacter termitis]|uniref:DNA-binding response regulator, OmpR family, contains REC and winged-helix (WHTH) domain n=1 Tax=Pilibacter termitis TaxID=263852 RepID=A0A1T4M6U3_9ENTE|nr:response regulator transcription factor [Pilibacter termitis]SJZ62498.1 DNA-binding response regulator, OmpR family, contains REC and winged-helix (wHTH) domain [Pilibacter termitis]
MDIKILVADDDEAIRTGVKIYLKQAGFVVYEAENGLEALEKIKQEKFQLLILDIMMPKMDGFAVSERLRSEGNNIPILMLSAKSEEADKVNGLMLGADDYLTKPFSPVELVARVKSMLRRFMDLGKYTNSEEAVLTLGGLVLDEKKRTISVDGEIRKMTPKEYQITELMMKNVGKVFSIDEIYEAVWHESSLGMADNTVSVHIRKIREKIEANPKEPKYLKVVWGVGYKMEDSI